MQQAESHVASENQTDGVQLERAVGEMANVFTRRRPTLYRGALRFLGNPADAEDAVQDALLSAYKHLDQFKGRAQISTWLTSIVYNCARMMLRRRPRQIHLSLEERVGENHEYSVSDQLADGAPNPEDQLQRSEAHLCLRRSVGQLSPTLRKTFQLYEIDGFSIRETADLLAVPEGTVKARVARARKKLRESMSRALYPQRPTLKLNKSANI